MTPGNRTTPAADRCASNLRPLKQVNRYRFTCSHRTASGRKRRFALRVNRYGFGKQLYPFPDISLLDPSIAQDKFAAHWLSQIDGGQNAHSLFKGRSDNFFAGHACAKSNKDMYATTFTKDLACVSEVFFQRIEHDLTTS